MFRNIPISIPREVSHASICEVHDDKIVDTDLCPSLPSSNDYSLADLLASGVRVQPVDTTIVHDSAATSSIAKDFVDNYVESSNSDEK